jgi:hypothetical protein
MKDLKAVELDESSLMTLSTFTDICVILEANKRQLESTLIDREKRLQFLKENNRAAYEMQLQ